MNLRQAALQALEALVAAYQGKDKTGQVTEAIAAVRAALAEPRPIQECYGDCPTNPQTCPNPCNFEGRPKPEQNPFGDDAERYARKLHEEREAYKALFTKHKPEQEPVAHSVVAGALFDFMGWLTSRRERLVLSSVDNAAPAADAIKEFAGMRGLSIKDAQVKEWQDNITAPTPRKPQTTHWEGCEAVHPECKEKNT